MSKILLPRATLAALACPGLPYRAPPGLEGEQYYPNFILQLTTEMGDRSLTTRSLVILTNL